MSPPLPRPAGTGGARQGTGGRAGRGRRGGAGLDLDRLGVARRDQVGLGMDRPAWQAELVALVEAQQGAVLTAQVVVDWARAHPTSAVAARLTWGDAEAAEAWRRHQAEAMLRSIRVEVIQGEAREVPIVVHLPSDGEGYRATSWALEHREAEVTRAEAARAAAALRRARLFPRMRALASLGRALADLERLMEV